MNFSGESQRGEERPLLSGSREASPARGSPSQAELPTRAWSRRHLLISSILVLITVMQAAVFVTPAMNHLVEAAACQQLHPDVTDCYDDPICKSADVQDRLAMIMGWETTFALIPALATAIPYGIFADRYGPKVLLLLVVVGGFVVQVGELITGMLPGHSVLGDTYFSPISVYYPQTFDLRGIWVSSVVGNLIGGGQLGLDAMQYALATLLARESNRQVVVKHRLLQLTFKGPIYSFTQFASRSSLLRLPAQPSTGP